MSKRSASHRSVTPTGTADTTNLADTTYPFAIQGGTSLQKVNISEVFMGGQAAASAPTIMVLGRDFQVGTGSLTLGANEGDAPIAATSLAIANPPASFNSAATNKPQRSSTLGCLLNLSFNAFGGIVRWVAPDVPSYVTLVGNVTALGEISLSAFSGGTPGLLGAHMIYEAE